jgi:hypothetical protein
VGGWLMRSRLFVYDPQNPGRDGVLAVLCNYVEQEGRRLHIEVKEPKRTLEQNARMWAMLSEVSKQVQWPVDGVMQTISPEDWKEIFTASLRKEQRVSQGLSGGFVLLGARTSKMSKAELGDLMTLIEMFGAERGVVFADFSNDMA